MAHGKYQEWIENGNLLMLSEYKNGQLLEEGYYVNDVKQLGYKWYKPNGEFGVFWMKRI